MRDGDLDYSAYTLRELEEALAGIDARKYPRNHRNLLAAHAAAGGGAPPPLDPPLADREEAEELARWRGPEYDEHGRYVPNRIPAKERARHVGLSLLLIGYGGYGVWVNDLYLPGRRAGVHLHDEAAWLMYAAMLAASLVLLSVVVDHYDRRDNERHYRRVARGGAWLGWSLFAASVFWAVTR
jgi:hypothetical protein